MDELTVLVPLDTTPHSETALRLLPMLKTLGFTNVRLVSVLDEKRAKDVANAEALNSYLTGHAERLTSQGFHVDVVVKQGKADEAVLGEVADPKVDLVLIATHGRTGIARLRLGSVADKIIKDSICPTLVVGPNVEIDLENYGLRRILVPLDGSPLSELSLPIAKHLAEVTGAEIDLLRCVQLNAMAADPMMASAQLLTAMEDEAESYLARTAASLEGFNVHTTLMRGAPAETILMHLKEHPVDLVIMASNGRTGLMRSAMGSVAERVLHGPDPVLIFEPHEDRSKLFDRARGAGTEA